VKFTQFGIGNIAQYESVLGREVGKLSISIYTEEGELKSLILSERKTKTQKLNNRRRIEN